MMESGLKSPRKPAKAVAVRPLPRSPEKNSSQSTEFINDLAILNDALVVGREYFEATGTYPTYDNFQALYINGYSDYTPSDVERIFGDWETFQADTKTAFDDYKKEIDDQRSKILEIIELDSKVGAIHPMLFKKLASEAQGAAQEQEYDGSVFADDDVEDDIKIDRYLKFKIAEAMTPNLESSEIRGRDKKVPPPTRRTSIALGFNVDTGAVSSSFIGELRKSISYLSTEEITSKIEDTAVTNGWYEFLYKDLRPAHLQQLVLATESCGIYPAPEKSFFDTRQMKLLGGLALKKFLQSDSPDSEVVHVSEMLIDTDTPLPEADRYKHKEWTKEDCLKYGKWLVGILEHADNNAVLTMPIITKAAKLGLGPNFTHLQARFNGSMYNFYEELGVEKKNPSGTFRNMPRHEVLDYIRSVASLNDGRISEAILRSHYRAMRKKGVRVPSPKILSGFCDDRIGELIEEAGFTVSIRSQSKDQVLANGVRYYLENGCLPTTTEISATDYFPHWASVSKKFGKIGEFHACILEALQSGCFVDKLSLKTA